MLSVVIPSRGRPESLARCLESLATTKSEYEVIVGIDDDDVRARDYDFVRQRKNHRLIQSPRQKSLGALVNRLADMASGETVMMFTDDYRLHSHDWVEKTLAAIARLPNGVGLVFPRDGIQPGFPGVVTTTRKTRDLIGYWTVDYFPFWYADTWWDELAILSGVVDEIDLDTGPIDGRGGTIGLRDVGFWTGFFEVLRPDRIRDAAKIAAAAFADHPDVHARIKAETRLRQEMCFAKTVYLRDPVNHERWKAREEGEPSPRYLALKAEAERIWEKAALANQWMLHVGG
ncbi:MAG TPA: glycosyltransferase family A protein [Rhizomicrobium sp.]|nr:glycosyltransferase family A protein [Rhizomicrobium sp.]